MRSPSKQLEKDIAPVPSWGGRLVGLEGLRGFAAFSVLIVHTAAQMAPDASVSGGIFWTAVAQLRHGLTLFFVLSGFLLFRPFVTAVIAGKQRPPLGRFWLNRALRIYPAYLAILLIVSFVLQTARVAAIEPDVHSDSSGMLPPIDLLWSLTMFQTLNPEQFGTGLGVAWSLTTELTFYLMLPLLGLLAAGIAKITGGRIIAAATPVVLLFATGIIGKVWVATSTAGMGSDGYYAFNWGHSWETVISRSILVQGDLFALGMGAAVVYVCLEQNIIKRGRTNLGLIAAGIGLVGFAFLTIKQPLGYTFVDTTAAAAASCLLLLTVFPTSAGRFTVFAHVLEWRPIVYLGIVSYSVYLWHMPVILWLKRYGLTFDETVGGFLVNALVVSAVTLGLASATYFGVEKQALKLKRRTDASNRGASSSTRAPVTG